MMMMMIVIICVHFCVCCAISMRILYCFFLDLVRVYDGNEAVRQRHYRIVSAPKNAPVQVLLVCIQF